MLAAIPYKDDQPALKPTILLVKTVANGAPYIKKGFFGQARYPPINPRQENTFGLPN